MPGFGIQSSNDFLNEGFAWAKEVALGYVMTGLRGSIPWYWCGLLDRASFYIRDFVHQAPAAHLLGLDAENLTMLRAFAATQTAERQWYPIWNLDFDGDVFHMDYHHDRDFVREIPMTFELVETGYQLYRWTGQTEYIRDPVLWDYYTHAVTDFIGVHDHCGDGIAAEQTHSAWPFEGISTYNEADVPLAQAADGVAAQYQALLAYAAMQRARGDAAGADLTDRRAKSLYEYFQTHWWSDEAQMYARGRLADRTLITGWGIHPVTKFLTEPGPRTDVCLDQIERSTPYHTLRSIEMRSYLPQAFFPYGRNDTAWRRLADLISTRSNYPEVSYTVLSHVVEGLMGVEADAPAHRLATRSHLPAEIGWCEVDHIVMGDHDLAVRHDGAARTTLRHNAGSQAVRWEVQFDGTPASVQVGGQATPVRTRTVHGVAVSGAEVLVAPGQSVTAERS